MVRLNPSASAFDGGGGELTPEEITNLNTAAIDTGTVSSSATPVKKTNTQILKEKQAADAAARAEAAAANPLLNKAVIPTDAPAGYHYTWIGGTNTGSWKLYRDIVIPGLTPAGGGDYTFDASGMLLFKGSLFTGSYNGKDYVKGKATTPGTGGDYATVDGVLMFKGSPFTGSYNGKNYVNGKENSTDNGYWVHDSSRDTTNDDGTTNFFEYWSTDPKLTRTTRTSAANGTENWAGDGTPSSPFTKNGKAFTGTKFGSTYIDGVLKSTAGMDAETIAKEGRKSARQDFMDTLKGFGFDDDLIKTMDNMVVNDYSVSKMYLELVQTPAWKKRFPGMAALAASGKAIDAATYISQEKGYLQTLSAYGLDKNIFGTTLELGKYISNITSPREFEDRVAMAADRVNKNADVVEELNIYYNVDKAAAISYLLDPIRGIDIIKKQVRSAEIGAAAAASGFYFGVTQQAMAAGAEGLIAATGTENLFTLKSDFAKARTFADAQQRLTELEGDKPYNRMSAVNAVIGQDQATILESQKRATRETARFGGTSGVTASSLRKSSTI